MGILEFLELVLPSEGNRVVSLGKPKKDGGQWFDNKHYATTEEAARAAQYYDDQGETVYFAINSFGPEYEEEIIKDGKPIVKKRIRTKVNVLFCRALYDDFDVDVTKPAAYDTRDEAFDAVKTFFKAVRLSPTIVSSGGGFHSYIHLDRDVDVEVWQELSALKRDITTHLKLKADRNVDMDQSRILRPVGTHNRKTETPRPVELLKQGKTYSPDFIRERLMSYVKEHNIEPAPTARSHTSGTNPWEVLTGDYPDSYAEDVVEKCDAIRRFKESGGEDEPHWHKAIGVLKHCVDGEEKIHEWSSNYEGYSQQETQNKIDAWTLGPTTCIEMDRHVGCKEGCPFAEKCTSPIQLGYREEAESVAEETVVTNAGSTTPTTPQGATIEGQHIPYWPQTGYRWNGSALSRAVTDADGVVSWQPFCRSFIYPINRIKDSEGTWVIHWRTKEKNGAWRDFFMPTLELASTDQMAKTLAANEVFLMRTKNARGHMAEFAEGLIEKLQEWRIETATIKQFGWTEDRSGFILGTTMITKDGEEAVLCDADMPSDIAADFGRKGTLDEWVRNIDTMYNRKGAEPYQFALCHSMGSALVELMGSSNWHGLPLAFTGHGGTGKTTACKIACGFYGNPKFMNRQTGDQGSTLGAAIKRIAIMGSIPMLMDEFSGRSADELTRTAYALANGRDKERLNSKGGFATTGNEWFKNSFITSNDGLSETISKLPAGYKVEATQLRFFEVSLPRDYLQQHFSDLEQGVTEYHMDNVYGEACRPFLRFIIKNQDWVRRQITAARSKFNPQSEDDNKERFYRDTIVTALVAGKIASKLGLVSFDINNMKKWALAQVVSMRESRKETNTDISEHLASYIATLPGRLIITNHFADGRSRANESAQEPLRGPAVGRVATEDKRMFVTCKSVSDWCKDNGVTPAAMKEEMDRAGYLIYRQDGEVSPRITLGAGSKVPSGQARCYELKYHKLFDGKSLSLVKTDGGVKTETMLEGNNG